MVTTPADGVKSNSQLHELGISQQIFCARLTFEEYLQKPMKLEIHILQLYNWFVLFLFSKTSVQFGGLVTWVRYRYRRQASFVHS